MSIWSSLNADGDSIAGLDWGDVDGKGEPCITVDVATTWIDHARLSISGEDGTVAEGVDATVLLPPEELRRLAALLLQAADSCDRTRERYGDLNWQAQAERHAQYHRTRAAEKKAWLAKVSH